MLGKKVHYLFVQNLLAMMVDKPSTGRKALYLVMQYVPYFIALSSLFFL